MVIILIMVFTSVVFIEVPGLVRRKYWRELAVFSALMLFAFLVALLQSIGILKPGIMKGIAYLFRDVLHLYYK